MHFNFEVCSLHEKKRPEIIEKLTFFGKDPFKKFDKVGGVTRSGN